MLNDHRQRQPPDSRIILFVITAVATDIRKKKREKRRLESYPVRKNEIRMMAGKGSTELAQKLRKPQLEKRAAGRSIP